MTVQKRVSKLLATYQILQSGLLNKHKIGVNTGDTYNQEMHIICPVTRKKYFGYMGEIYRLNLNINKFNLPFLEYNWSIISLLIPIRHLRYNIQKLEKKLYFI